MAAAAEAIAVDVYWLVHAGPLERQDPWLRQRGDPATTAAVPHSRLLWFGGPCLGANLCGIKSRMAMAGGQLPLRQSAVSVVGKSGKVRGLKAQDLAPHAPRFEREALSRRLRGKEF